MIPRILSQTWKSANLPPAAETLRQGWRARNPELDYRFYDDDGCRQVVADAFPDRLAEYDALTLPILKADVFRYAVVYRDGGIYADIDMECLKPVGRLLERTGCLLSVEAKLTARRQAELGYREPLQVANCIFAAEPGHPLMRRAFERSLELFARHPAGQPISVEDISGPRMLTRLLAAERFDGLTILPQVVLMAPLDYPNIWPINAYMHARHRTFGTWKAREGGPSFARRMIERNRLPNPLPPGLGRLLSTGS
jgi:mannosyltransferase OCH1-like enzyme